MGAKGKWFKAAFIALVLFGLGLAADLTRVYVMVRIDPSFHSICAVNEQLNCLTVAESKYAAVLGIPVSIWGMGGYGAMLIVALASFSRRENLRDVAALSLLGMCIFSAMTGAYLFYISEFVIKVLCPFCAATYVTNALLLILAVLIVRAEGGMGVIARTGLWPADLKKQVGPATVFIPAASIVPLALAVMVFKFMYPSLEVELPKGPGGLPIGLTEDKDPWIGSRKPILTITEFSDYQCPHCRRIHALMRQTIEKYADQVRLIHRNLPLDHHCNRMLNRKFHLCSCQYASYAVCAADMGKFWEMSDYLFSLQDQDENECVSALEAANAVSIDREAFEQCLASDLPEKCIERDVECCIKLGIHATPTFLCDGDTFVGGIDDKTIVEKLEKAKKHGPS